MKIESGRPGEEKETSLEDALSFAESIVDTIREPLLVLDGRLHVITASRAFYQNFGVSTSETEGRFLYELGSGQWNIPGLRKALEEILPQEKSFRDFEVEHDFPGLGHRVMLLNGRQIWREGNGTESVLLAIEDITERKRLREELLRSNEDLKRFAYVAAHDLRSPLNEALTLAKLLRQLAESKLNEDEQRIQTLLIESIERSTALMADILTYSGLSTSPRPMTLVPIRDSLQAALANLQHHIAETGAEVTVGTIPDVMSDGTHMSMVFQNLIGNALKYGRREVRIRIHIEAVAKGQDWLLSVADNGQGFEAQYAEQIFEPFKRLHGGEIPGSGIGLATCRRIIDKLGGRIWAESKPGEGSAFYFLLPKV